MARTTVNKRKVSLKIIHTSDVHGSVFTWDYVEQHPVKGRLVRVYAYVQSLRKTFGERFILLDGGDMLQGNPVMYYSRFMGLPEDNLAAEVMNYMCYDAGTIGNHDIEMGHAIYDSWREACRFPVLGANVIDKERHVSCMPPYCVLERGGLKVAILGMTTPAVPNRLPPALWSGLEFEDMVTCARHWVPLIRQKEQPDILIGLFHSGKQGEVVTEKYAENAALDVARKVAGFDVVCYGHDHLRNCETVQDPEGHEVVCCSPSSMAVSVGEIDIDVEFDTDGRRRAAVSGKVTDLSLYKNEYSVFMSNYFKRYQRNAEYYVEQKIGMIGQTIESTDVYFGPSAFVDYVHRVQLELTGADISFAAPVSFAARIRKGDVHVRDVFKLYRYDDVLYTLRLTGKEIKGALEMSSGFWVGQMKRPEDHVMCLDYVLDDGKRLGFKHLAYNFDSAAGLCYTVDVTRPAGQKITVTALADGRPFDAEAWYTVAVNSYRGNGGGELLTLGAGISQERLHERLISATPCNLRTCLIEYIRKKARSTPVRSPVGS